jgi:hypothetical protein
MVGNDAPCHLPVTSITLERLKPLQMWLPAVPHQAEPAANSGMEART